MTNYLCTLRGTLASGTLGEIFSHSIAVSSSKTAAQVAGVVTAAWEAALNTGTAPTLRGSYPSSVSWTEGTAAAILDLHEGKLAAATHVAYGAPWTGTHASPMLPPQLAVAVSIRGGFHSNGTPIKGRFYLPPPTVAAVFDPAGEVTDVFQGKALNAAVTFLNTIIGGGDLPCVWSRKDGKLERITQVRVGNKFDTVRSRRNGKPETYLIGTGLTPPALVVASVPA